MVPQRFPMTGLFSRGIHLFLIVALLLLPACASSSRPPASARAAENYKNLALAKYGEGVEFIFNESETHVLCLKQNKVKLSPALPQDPLRFFVYDLQNEKIVYEDSIEDGSVNWISNSELQISIIPGIVSGDENPEDFTYIYDVKELRKK